MSESYREMYKNAMTRACASENLLGEMQTENEVMVAQIHSLKRTLRYALSYFDIEIAECEGCGYISELGVVSHGPDCITVCPDCRSVESFVSLEVE